MRQSRFQPLREAAGKPGGGGCGRQDGNGEYAGKTPERALTNYDNAKRALALAHSVDEVKDIRDRAMALATYARQAKDTELIGLATEIRMRAERRLGEMVAAQPKATGTRGQLEGSKDGTGGTAIISGGSAADPPEQPAPITLAQAGIDKHLADRARKAARMSDEVFEARVETAKRKAESSATVSPRHPRTEFSGEMERGTPVQFIEAARLVMGEIDLDPYSAEIWQRNIEAGDFFTIDKDALKREWHGRVFMNCPYRQPDITKAVEKLLEEYNAGRVTEAIALLPGSCDPEWFHAALGRCEVICFMRGRIRFLNSDGNEMDSPPLGSIFIYIGKRRDRFAEVFSQFGTVLPVGGALTVVGQGGDGDRGGAEFRKLFPNGLDQILPNGKRLGDCTRRDLVELSKRAKQEAEANFQEAARLEQLMKTEKGHGRRKGGGAAAKVTK